MAHVQKKEIFEKSDLWFIGEKCKKQCELKDLSETFLLESDLL